MPNIEHLLAMADLVVSRAGASSIAEMVAVKKPSILLPLSESASRGEQIENARYCEQLGISHVIRDEDLSAGCLIRAVLKGFAEHDRYLTALAGVNIKDAQRICDFIAKVPHSKSKLPD